MKNWNPPVHWLKITTIDAHTAGEPFRVITAGLPDLPGKTILALPRHEFLIDPDDPLKNGFILR